MTVFVMSKTLTRTDYTQLPSPGASDMGPFTADDVHAFVQAALRAVEDLALQEASLQDSPSRYWAIRSVAEAIHAYAAQTATDD